ncbi:hypothetical protein ACFXK0_07490 [Nocardia sp. NPDC059177]|uniref:hypothetical protein n=1 Tax=Nocardia sp. NPDC059177 TaxID=3346759 RepID=UPI003692B85E
MVIARPDRMAPATVEKPGTPPMWPILRTARQLRVSDAQTVGHTVTVAYVDAVEHLPQLELGHDLTGRQREEDPKATGRTTARACFSTRYMRSGVHQVSAVQPADDLAIDNRWVAQLVVDQVTIVTKGSGR